MAFQDHLRTLGQLARDAHDAGWIDQLPSLRDSVHVAVIGEIKRGKSTFLNALMGEKVFPSRSSVCTTAVTFLQDGVPAIQAIYRPELDRAPDTRTVGPDENIFDCLQEMVAKPNLQGKKGNPNARDLDAVVVSYPNRFATDGVRLVDTPGVNDPESWREEITFQFLPQVDAALMLLDPMMPLSKSEMDFIRNRATKAVKNQLLIVVSRCDEVKPADLVKSVARIRRELEPLLPEVRIYSVASKPALEAKLAKDVVPESWTRFEQSLDGFLHAGKAGALLLSRAQGIHDEVAAVHRSRVAHLESLARAGSEEKARLTREEVELGRIRAGVGALRERSRGLLAMHRERLTTHLGQFLSTQRSQLRGIPDEQLPPFTSRFLRDLQDQREAWIRSIASDLEGVLLKEVQALAGRGASVRSFEIPSLRGLDAAPAFSVPEAKQSSNFKAKVTGGLIGSILFGPIIGAGIGFLAGHLFGGDGADQGQAAYADYRQECGRFLEGCTAAVNQDVESLLQSMECNWVPQFFDPLQVELDRQAQRVAETQVDLGKGEQERYVKVQGLAAEHRRLEAMLQRTSGFLSDLREAGSASAMARPELSGAN